MEITNNQLIVNGVTVANLPELPYDTNVMVYSVPIDYRANGYFVTTKIAGQPDELPACDLSTTELLGELSLYASAAEKLNVAKAAKLSEINAAFDIALADIVSKYPENEIKSWPQQVKEAEAFTSDPLVDTPLLTAIAANRGFTVANLASKILTNMSAYATSSGALIGRRQAAEDMIGAAVTAEDLSSIAL